MNAMQEGFHVLAVAVAGLMQSADVKAPMQQASPLYK